ncbi:MAG: carbohydrate kinase family protein [Blastocatellia bacterium]
MDQIFKVRRPRPTIIGAGLIALDVVISSDASQPPKLWAGGTCGNVLTILSYLGWQSYALSRLNGDTASERVKSDLTKWGVRLDFAESQPAAQTPIIVQQIRKNMAGEPFHKFSWNCPGCGAGLPSYKPLHASAARQIATRMNDPKVFFLDRVSRGALILAEASRQKGALIVFEPSGVGDARLFQEAVALAHVLKYSNERRKQMADIGPTDGALLEVETLGQEGLSYRSSLDSCRTDGWQHLEAYQAHAVKDTAGAGDWGTAGIIHCLGQGGLEGFQSITAPTLQDALRFGQALSTWNCRFEGARGGMYSIDKETFRSDIQNILSGQTAIESMPQYASRAILDIVESICPACTDRRQST